MGVGLAVAATIWPGSTSPATIQCIAERCILPIGRIRAGRLVHRSLYSRPIDASEVESVAASFIEQ